MSDRLLRRLAASRLERPLPERLRQRLSAIGQETESSESSSASTDEIGPWPQLPLPYQLRKRLEQIPHSPEAAAPRWVRTPRYAIVASYLLAVLSWLIVDDPVAWGATLARTLGDEVQSTARLVESETLRWLGRAESSVDRALNDTYSSIKTTADELIGAWLTESPAGDSSDSVATETTQDQP